MIYVLTFYPKVYPGVKHFGVPKAVWPKNMDQDAGGLKYIMYVYVQT